MQKRWGGAKRGPMPTSGGGGALVSTSVGGTPGGGEGNPTEKDGRRLRHGLDEARRGGVFVPRTASPPWDHALNIASGRTHEDEDCPKTPGLRALADRLKVRAYGFLSDVVANGRRVGQDTSVASG